VRIATALTKQHPAFRPGLISWGDGVSMDIKEFTKELLGQIENGQLNRTWENENIRLIARLMSGLTHNTVKDSDALQVATEKVEAIHTAVHAAMERYQAHIWDVYDKKAEFDIGDVNVFLMLLYGSDARIADATKVQKTIQDGASGGMRAADVRARIRIEVKEKIKETIRKKYLWNDATQTLQSITETIWADIHSAIQNGSDWHGITNTDLLQAKIGRQSVYDAVKETDPR